MAKVFGKNGEYSCDQIALKRRQIWKIYLFAFLFLGFAEGYCVTAIIPAGWMTPIAKIAAFVPILIGTFVCVRFIPVKLNKLEKEQLNHQKGVIGETKVGQVLSGLTDDYYVINGLATTTGDLDHIVIGPTGVFVVETKNWRGTVAADGKGGLLLNGRPTDKPSVNHLLSRLMEVKEKADDMVPGGAPYFRPVMVFPSAKVDAKWGTTKNVLCMHYERVYRYILEHNFERRLARHEVTQIAEALLKIAGKDA